MECERHGKTKKFDVLVAGGGVAGCAAAISAARLGKSVVLVEKGTKLGGLATTGLINLFVPMCNGRGKQIIFGMAEEFLELAAKYGYGDTPADFADGKIPEEKLEKYRFEGKLPPRLTLRFSPEIFALALLELCVDCGVRIMFDSLLCDVVREDDASARGVCVETKSGRETIFARYFVDCTGDADLFRRAGVPTVTRGNFHSYLAIKTSLDSLEVAVREKNVARAFSYITGGGANLYGDGHDPKNSPYVSTDSDDVNRYLISNQLELLDKIKGDERKSRDIVALPGMPQFRTGAHLAADYSLREEDKFRHFGDSIGAICDFDRRDILYEIPLRTMVRSDCDNIIAAGRCAAGDGYGWDVLRVIPPAIITGQAAGIACSLAIDRDVPISKVDYAALSACLTSQNVRLHFDDSDVPKDTSAEIEHND